MSVKYEILKRLVKAANIKKMWTGMSTEELLENRRKQNAKNRIPDLKDEAFDISRIEIMGCPVLKLIHKKKANKANLFLIGGGMISAPRPGSIKKALRFAKETGLDVFVPYYPLCTDYPLTRAYEMIHETYRIMLQDYKAENTSVLGTSSGGNLALGMVPYINDGHGDTPMPGYIMAISPGTCAASFETAMKKYKVDYEMIIGEGMFHCYPVFPICKEGKDGWNMMVRLIKKYTK